jgi:hypothetical protein
MVSPAKRRRDADAPAAEPTPRASGTSSLPPSSPPQMFTSDVDDVDEIDEIHGMGSEAASEGDGEDLFGDAIHEFVLVWPLN